MEVDSKPNAEKAPTPVIITGIIIGVGIAGFFDETFFHQILQWHSFYWATSEKGRILSDGLFHLFSTSLLFLGGFRLWRNPQSHSKASKGFLFGGILVGAGGFNVYDGVVQHLIFHFHLVNEYVCPNPQANNTVLSCPRDIPLEAIWIGVGLVLVISGLYKIRGSKLNHSR